MALMLTGGSPALLVPTLFLVVVGWRMLAMLRTGACILTAVRGELRSSDTPDAKKRSCRSASKVWAVAHILVSEDRKPR
jgi:hypothetical protein